MEVLSVKQMAQVDFPLILFFEIKTNFFATCYACVFYSFYNKYASFIVTLFVLKTLVHHAYT